MDQKEIGSGLVAVLLDGGSEDNHLHTGFHNKEEEIDMYNRCKNAVPIDSEEVKIFRHEGGAEVCLVLGKTS